MKKVMFISSTGGHFSELMKLEPMFKNYKVTLVTESSKNKKKLKKSYKKYNIKFLLSFSDNKFINILKLFINCFISLFYFVIFRPKYIVTTGAHTSGPMCCIGKIFRSKIIFIETMANITSPTATGKRVYKFADLFIVQWEDMLKVYPKAVYGGWII
ncbi:MAG: polysaccharide biosynthesis protein [Bacilli bacterium]|nr:polysaccharide biosynthesis protein [Bacilli bacterium]